MNQPITVESLHKQLTIYQQDTDKRLDEGDERMDGLHTSVDSIKEDTSTLVSIMEAAEGFFKFAKWIGIGIKWIAGITLAVGVIIGVVTHK